MGRRCTGWASLRDVRLVYALADAFVLPSSYETFSLVTFEAAASGLPVLATPVSGVRELIKDGRNGFLITRDPPRSPSACAQLAADPALGSRLGGAARESALEFSWEAWSPSTRRCTRGCQAKQGPSRPAHMEVN